MIVFYLIGFLLLSGAIVILLGLTPESITNDIMRLISPKQTLRDKVLIAKGKKKSKKLTAEILHIKEALDATGKVDKALKLKAGYTVMIPVHFAGRRLFYLRVPLTVTRSLTLKA